jgi:very-short-patch-repair endonuclease
MSVTATVDAASLSAIPAGHVVRLSGVTPEQLAVMAHPLPPGAPVVLRYRLSTVPAGATAVVDAMLDRLEAVARDLLPAWLPEAELLDAAGDHDRRVVRMLARRRAAGTSHFGPFLAAMAESALLAQPRREEFSRQTRVRGLTRLLGDAYGRDAVAVLTELPAGMTAGEQAQVAAAVQWLSDYGDLGVWLAADALPEVDRIATVALSAPAAADVATGPAVDYPAPIGRPHPASRAEQTLERCLARCAWAGGREWNQIRSGHPLVPLIRVDLMWQAERCVVEIDGPDHRGALKFADDRRRDNALTLDGFAVLRFTNDEVVDDPVRVLATIERLLSTRRRQKGDHL